MKITAVIPARYGSSRLEGKPLKEICGKPMIQHVYERVLKAELVQDVIVATDDERIVAAVEAFGGRAKLTSKDHKSGTDRVAEVMRVEKADIVANVQGDEPLIEPRMIDEAIQPLVDDPELMAATLCTPILNEADYNNPNVVKTVKDLHDNAMFFSRSLIPYPRHKEGFQPFEHIGIYVFRYNFLMRFVELAQTPMEKVESLEQLRILENGYRLRVRTTQYPYNAVSVDTQEDLDAVRAIIQNQEK
jgi:3-deoxy-manno-octulosonate cytidylyltransferase (CMP-KDO synthetase)